MCTIIKKNKRKTFTGYKFVMKVDGKYYSPFTGYRYKSGTLPKMKKALKNVNNMLGSVCYGEILHGKFYTKAMQGKTGVMKRLTDVKDLLGSDVEYYVLLKMTIGGDLYDGKFDAYETIVGTEIIDFKEV